MPVCACDIGQRSCGKASLCITAQHFAVTFFHSGDHFYTYNVVLLCYGPLKNVNVQLCYQQFCAYL